ncbi:MAG: hypothetical protein JNK82_14295 [Myxococcaceae bacterium]|nr:hypothetical protein [Myxococcaceae bacterium]
MRPAPAVAAALLGGLVACDDFEQLAAMKPRLLTVELRDRHVFSEDAGAFFVFSTSGRAVDGWVLASGGWVEATGTWVDAGVCELTAPRGFTYLRRPDGPDLFEVEGNQVDLGSRFIGPPHREASANTTVTFDVEGAVGVDARTVTFAWVQSTLQAQSNLTGLGSSVEPVGVTSATRYSFAARWSGLPLLEAEPVTVFQAAPLANGWVLARHGAVSVTSADGRDVQPPRVQLTDLPALGVPVPSTSIDVGAWPQQLADGVIAGEAVGVAAETHAFIAWAGGVLPAQAVYGGPAAALVLPELTIDPLPDAGWVPRIEVSVDYTSTLPISADAGLPLPFSAFLSAPVSDFALNDSTVPLPVEDIEADVEKDRVTLTSRTPTLTWSRRSPANRYQVVPIRIAADGAFEFGTSLRVFAERCPIPPGVLEPDSEYIFLIQAENCGVANATAPLRRTLQPRCSSVYARSRILYTP